MKKLNREQTVDYLYKAILLLVLIVSAVLVLNFLFPAVKNILRFVAIALLPFLLAWFISFLTEPFAVFMHKKLRIHKALAAIIIILIFLGAIVLISTLVFNRVWTAISEVLSDLPGFTASLLEFVGNLQNLLTELNENTNLKLR